MNHKEVGLLETPCECGIELPGSISHGVNYTVYTDIHIHMFSALHNKTFHM